MKKVLSRTLFLLPMARALWALTLLTIPITSFPLFPAGEATYVRPLAFFPLALLLLVLLVCFFRREIMFPRLRVLTPLLVFIFVAAIASGIGLWLAPIPVRGQDVVGRMLRAWITLVIGIMFFLASAWMDRDEKDLRFTLRWLLAGLMLDVGWSSVQAASLYLQLLPRELVNSFQRLFSLRSLVRTDRISGMAYEPAWLAGQLTTIYLPWLTAMVLTGYRAFRHRWIGPALLFLTLVVLVGTLSRGGLLTVVVAGLITGIAVGRGQIGSAWRWLTGRAEGGAPMWLRASALVAGLALITGAGYYLASRNYINQLWSQPFTTLEDFMIRNYAGARGAYLVAALNIFSDYPWTGVGLGASGLYMYQRLPQWSLTFIPEVARLLSPQVNLLANPKNLFARILAETGIVGFSAYLSFLLSVLGVIILAVRHTSLSVRTAAVAGLFAWIALLIYNSTQDSFAIPNLWLNFGILAGLLGGRSALAPDSA